MATANRHKSTACGRKEFKVCQAHPKKCNEEKCLKKEEEIIQQLKEFPSRLVWYQALILLGLGSSKWLQLHKAEFWLGPMISEASSGLVCVRQGCWRSWPAFTSKMQCVGVVSMPWRKDLISPWWMNYKGTEERKEVKGDGNWKENKKPGHLEEEGIPVWTDSLVRKWYKNKLNLLPNMTLQQHKVGINLEMAYWREYRVKLDQIVCV